MSIDGIEEEKQERSRYRLSVAERVFKLCRVLWKLQNDTVSHEDGLISFHFLKKAQVEVDVL